MTTTSNQARKATTGNIRGLHYDDASTGGNKRRRVALACQSCRTRKTRCDGGQPRCSACVEMGYDCAYTSTTGSANMIVGKDYLQGLENRIKGLERSFQSLQPSVRVTDAQTSWFDRAEQNLDQNGNDTLVEDSESDDDEGVDALGTVVFADEEESGFYGPSSNIALLRQVSQAAFGASTVMFFSPSGPTNVGDQLHSGLVSIPRPGSTDRHTSPALTRKDLFLLPQESEALELLSMYFSNTGYLYPYIHQETFMAIYYSINTQAKPAIPRTWLGLLNAIFAIAITTNVGSDLSVSQRLEKSETFYQRAVGLCEKHILRGTSIEIVQYLLISAQYLQGTQKALEAWTVSGLAVRAAMQLGLHSSESSRHLTPLECEIRKRVWFGCVVLDRSMSMTFGRPSAIPEEYIQLELPQPFPADDPAQAKSSAEDINPANIVFFTNTISLYRIMWSIIESMYGQNLACGKESQTIDLFGKLYALEQRLLQWRRSLPAPLCILSQDSPPSPSTSGPERKLCTILTLRYLNIHLLLHRPVLVKFFDCHNKPRSLDEEDVLLYQVGTTGLVRCHESATKVIALVHSALKTRDDAQGLFGAWWFTLYYTFNAALIDFGCYFVTRPRPNAPTTTSSSGICISHQDATKNLSDAIEALTLLDPGNRMVERCRYYLQTLSTVISAIETGGGGGGEEVNALPTDVTATAEHRSFDNFAPSDLQRNKFTDAVSWGMNFGELIDFNM